MDYSFESRKPCDFSSNLFFNRFNALFLKHDPDFSGYLCGILGYIRIATAFRRTPAAAAELKSSGLKFRLRLIAFPKIPLN
ncbi:MAG: hypothetical protein C4325_05125 [Blastocatellia bacterium]